jgi:hypothetical protein
MQKKEGCHFQERAATASFVAAVDRDKQATQNNEAGSAEVESRNATQDQALVLTE